MPDEVGTPSLRPRTILTWVVVNLVLGYCAIFPLVTAVMTGSYVQAKIWGDQAAPFGSQEAAIAVVIIIIGAILLVSAFVVANRALRRRLQSWRPATFWLPAIAVQLAPFVWFMTCTDRTIPVMLGMSLF
jgi:hypothetical protein